MAKKKNTQPQQPAPIPPAEEKQEKKGKKTSKKQQKQNEKSKQPKVAEKTKQIQKEQKSAKPTKQQKQPAPSKSSKKQQTSTIGMLTPEFYTKINVFQAYYKQVLELKSSSTGSDLTDELNAANTRIRESLQDATSKILKQELATLQDWIKGQQKRLKQQILTVEKCKQSSQKSLESTKAFTVPEITGQLQLIQKRIDEKQSQLDRYGILLSRAKEIYQVDETKKVEAKPLPQQDDDVQDNEAHGIDIE